MTSGNQVSFSCASVVVFPPSSLQFFNELITRNIFPLICFTIPSCLSLFSSCDIDMFRNHAFQLVFRLVFIIVNCVSSSSFVSTNSPNWICFLRLFTTSSCLVSLPVVISIFRNHGFQVLPGVTWTTKGEPSTEFFGARFLRLWRLRWILWNFTIKRNRSLRFGGSVFERTSELSGTIDVSSTRRICSLVTNCELQRPAAALACCFCAPAPHNMNLDYRLVNPTHHVPKKLKILPLRVIRMSHQVAIFSIHNRWTCNLRIGWIEWIT